MVAHGFRLNSVALRDNTAVALQESFSRTPRDCRHLRFSQHHLHADISPTNPKSCPAPAFESRGRLMPEGNLRACEREGRRKACSLGCSLVLTAATPFQPSCRFYSHTAAYVCNQCSTTASCPSVQHPLHALTQYKQQPIETQRILFSRYALND